MNTVPGSLQLLSAASIGVYAGAMLTEGFILVPYWRSASAPEFLLLVRRKHHAAPGFLRTCHLGRRALRDRHGRRDARGRAARAMDSAGGRVADGHRRIQV